MRGCLATPIFVFGVADATPIFVFGGGCTSPHKCVGGLATSFFILGVAFLFLGVAEPLSHMWSNHLLFILEVAEPPPQSIRVLRPPPFLVFWSG